MATTSAPSWTLGDRLRKAREHAGLTQDEMAQHLGLSRAALSAYERDSTSPKLAVLRVWAQRCGVPLGWLTGEVQDPNHPGTEAATGRQHKPPTQGIRPSRCISEPVRRAA